MDKTILVVIGLLLFKAKLDEFNIPLCNVHVTRYPRDARIDLRQDSEMCPNCRPQGTDIGVLRQSKLVRAQVHTSAWSRHLNRSRLSSTCPVSISLVSSERVTRNLSELPFIRSFILTPGRLWPLVC